MKKKNVIITGGLGFIGSNLVEFFLKKKFKVLVIDRMTIGSNIKNLDKNKNLIIKKFDICNYSLMSECIEKFNPKVIYNLAAETHVDRSIKNPKSFVKSNILGVVNILEILRKKKLEHNFRFIQISTDEVFGDIRKGKKSLENDAYNPSSPYSSSKAASDLILKSYIRTYNLPIIITNCVNNFGPKQNPEKLIPKTIINILKNKNIPVYGTGRNEREWIYVKDHCKILYEILYHGKTGQTYNIGSGFVYNNLFIVKKIFSILKNKFKAKTKSQIIFVKDRPGHDFRYSLNSKKIFKTLRKLPKQNFEKSLIQTVKWYKEKSSYIK
tara:strand:+ start:2323 stop:3297 length:975 start_codon:yes stop_codon:yes gene_type:complete